ncbi:MAG UNVERIFIED_CONTAM: DUF2660 domain-containing protein [Rickettsiaceae bacterium]|jgi:hypothetical protein
MIEYGIIAALVIVGIFLYIKNRTVGGKTYNYEYEKTGDQNAQNLYNQKKSVDKVQLSAKELLDLSWKFLYDITEAVLNKFSADHRKAVKDCGQILMEYGGRYTHMVDKKNVMKNRDRARAVMDDQDENGLSR